GARQSTRVSRAAIQRLIMGESSVYRDENTAGGAAAREMWLYYTKSMGKRKDQNRPDPPEFTIGLQPIKVA
ncbi:hypothetical protein, partial [Fournierella sp.]|uniref:hypothetical protein n=1 Tax=Allofournierella sp. TaxID=1940256 RepID=UPI0025C5D445